MHLLKLTGMADTMRRTVCLIAVFIASLSVVCPPAAVSQTEPLPALATVTIASPRNGAVLSGGKIQISASFKSTEKQPVSTVKVYLDGKFISERKYDTPVAEGTAAFMWDTVRSTKGRHRLDIQIFSGTDYLGMATCVVTIPDETPSAQGLDLEPPEVKLLGLSEGQVISGKVRITVDAEDNSGKPPYVSIVVDKAVKSIRNFPPYSYEWDTSFEENGPHTIKVTAMDNAENRREVKPVHVIVRNAVTEIPIAAAPESAVPKLTTAVPETEPPVLSAPIPEPEPVVKVSSTIEEFRRTAAIPVEVSPEEFEIRETATPLPTLPSVPGETVVTTEVAGEKYSVGSPVAEPAAPEPANDLPAAEPEPTVRVENPLVVPPGVVSPQTSLSTVGSGPILMARAPNSDMPGPQFRGDFRLVTPRTQRAGVDIVEKSSVTQYVVKPGDSILGIAKKLSIPASELVRLNNIQDPHLIKVGDKLRLPSLKRSAVTEPKDSELLQAKR